MNDDFTVHCNSIARKIFIAPCNVESIIPEKPSGANENHLDTTEKHIAYYWGYWADTKKHWICYWGDIRKPWGCYRGDWGAIGNTKFATKKH